MYRTQILALGIRRLMKYQLAKKPLDNERFAHRLARLQLRLAIELSPQPAR
jgi:hypothetical protein